MAREARGMGGRDIVENDEGRERGGGGGWGVRRRRGREGGREGARECDVAMAGQDKTSSYPFL